MKKVVFRWVTTIIDFESEEEWKEYRKKHYWDRGISHFIKSEGWTGNDTFHTGKSVYTVEIYTEYNEKYNAGF